ncbi:hypothetical protein VTK56DRAFT_8520 [Thermocarpiscus australiensis]
MAPSKVTDKVIAAELSNAVRQIYNSPQRDQLTVNYARQRVEAKLKLTEGFLKEGDWKAKSKQIIHDALNDLENAEASEAEVSQAVPQTTKPKATNGFKKGSRGKEKRPEKARVQSEAETESGDISDASETPQRPTKKRRITKGTKGKQKIISDEEDEGVSDACDGGSGRQPSEPVTKRLSKEFAESDNEVSDMVDDSSESRAKAKKADTPKSTADDGSSELSDVIDEPPKRKKKSKAKEASKPTSSAPLNNDDSSSELSSVIDEAPPPKSKRKSKGAAPPKTAGGGRAGKSSAAAADVSPEDAQIKLLQSQLAKCGVRKVWAFEFKKRGAATPKQKIKCLKEMLAEVGMTGRFSEARAREIKEARELQADLQDVIQAEKVWGVGGGGRGARRRAVKSAKDAEVSEEEGGNKGGDGGGESDESEDEDGRPSVRGRGPARRRADLAFLDDESESD